MNDDNSEVVPVNCSFCGKEIECPVDMPEKVEKHACFECFTKIGDNISTEDLKKVHIDIPKKDSYDIMSKHLVDKMLIDVFPKLWAEHIDELKEMSKKDLAREMFAGGAFIAMANTMESFDEDDELKDLEETAAIDSAEFFKENDL